MPRQKGTLSTTRMCEDSEPIIYEGSEYSDEDDDYKPPRRSKTGSVRRKDRFKNEGEAERNARLEQNRLRTAAKRANETPSARAARLERDRLRSATKREKLMLAAIKDKKALEELKTIREKNRLSNIRRRESQTPEEIAARRERNRLRIYALRNGLPYSPTAVKTTLATKAPKVTILETTEEVIARREKNSLAKAAQRANETLEQREARLQGDVEKKLNKTSEERLLQRLREREAVRIKKSLETPEEKQIRKALAKLGCPENETPEQQETRLFQEELLITLQKEALEARKSLLDESAKLHLPREESLSKNQKQVVEAVATTTIAQPPELDNQINFSLDSNDEDDNCSEFSLENVILFPEEAEKFNGEANEPDSDLEELLKGASDDDEEDEAEQKKRPEETTEEWTERLALLNEKKYNKKLAAAKSSKRVGTYAAIRRAKLRLRKIHETPEEANLRMKNELERKERNRMALAKRILEEKAAHLREMRERLRLRIENETPTEKEKRLVIEAERSRLREKLEKEKAERIAKLKAEFEARKALLATETPEQRQLRIDTELARLEAGKRIQTFEKSASGARMQAQGNKDERMHNGRRICTMRAAREAGWSQEQLEKLKLEIREEATERSRMLSAQFKLFEEIMKTGDGHGLENILAIEDNQKVITYWYKKRTKKTPEEILTWRRTLQSLIEKRNACYLEENADQRGERLVNNFEKVKKMRELVGDFVRQFFSERRNYVTERFKKKWPNMTEEEKEKLRRQREIAWRKTYHRKKFGCEGIFYPEEGRARPRNTVYAGPGQGAKPKQARQSTVKSSISRNAGAGSRKGRRTASAPKRKSRRRYDDDSSKSFESESDNDESNSNSVPDYGHQEESSEDHNWAIDLDTFEVEVPPSNSVYEPNNFQPQMGIHQQPAFPFIGQSSGVYGGNNVDPSQTYAQNIQNQQQHENVQSYQQPLLATVDQIYMQQFQQVQNQQQWNATASGIGLNYAIQHCQQQIQNYQPVPQIFPGQTAKNTWNTFNVPSQQNQTQPAGLHASGISVDSKQRANTNANVRAPSLGKGKRGRPPGARNKSFSRSSGGRKKYDSDPEYENSQEEDSQVQTFSQVEVNQIQSTLSTGTEKEAKTLCSSFVIKVKEKEITEKPKISEIPKKSEIEQLNCSHCSMVFFTKVSLERHERNMHGTVDFKCSVCEQVFSSPRTLVGHIWAVHYDGPNWQRQTHQCPFCPQKRNWERYKLHRHIKKVHPAEEFTYVFGANDSDKLEKAKQFRCNCCTSVFDSYLKLYQHFSSSHEKLKYVCEVCGILLAMPDNLADHKILFHPEKQHEETKAGIEIEKDQMFNCDTCDSTFISKGFLEKHEIYGHASSESEKSIDESKKRNQCFEECDKKCRRKGALIDHRETCHFVKNKCYWCTETFDDMESRQRHLYEVHVDEKSIPKELLFKPFKCELCKNSYLTIFAMRLHFNTKHFGAEEKLKEAYFNKNIQRKTVENKVANVANAVAASLSSESANSKPKGKSRRVNIPLNSQDTEVITRTCPVCSNGFTDLNFHNLHRRYNTLLKKYCELCNKLYSERHDFLKHVRSAHNGVEAATKYARDKSKEQTTFTCGKCFGKFTAEEFHYHHSRFAADAHLKKCRFCDQRFVKYAMAKHVDEVHSDKPTRRQRVEKEDKEEEEALTIVLAKETGKGGENPIAEQNLHTCHICLNHFKTEEFLEKHLTKQHEGIPNTPKPTCFICNQTFTNARNFHRHRKHIHSEVGRKHQCPHCPTKMTKLQNIKLHLFRIHGIRPNEDPLSAPVKTRPGLARVVHTEESLYPCNYCTRIFQKQETLDKHVQTMHLRTLLDSFCDFCGMQIQSSAINDHLKQFHPEHAVSWPVRIIRATKAKKLPLSELFKLVKDVTDKYYKPKQRAEKKGRKVKTSKGNGSAKNTRKSRKGKFSDLGEIKRLKDSENNREINIKDSEEKEYNISDNSSDEDNLVSYAENEFFIIHDDDDSSDEEEFEGESSNVVVNKRSNVSLKHLFIEPKVTASTSKKSKVTIEEIDSDVEFLTKNRNSSANNSARKVGSKTIESRKAKEDGKKLIKALEFQDFVKVETLEECDNDLEFDPKQVEVSKSSRSRKTKKSMSLASVMEISRQMSKTLHAGQDEIAEDSGDEEFICGVDVDDESDIDWSEEDDYESRKSRALGGSKRSNTSTRAKKSVEGNNRVPDFTVEMKIPFLILHRCDDMLQI